MKPLPAFDFAAWAYEDHLARMLSDALHYSISPNMRMISAEAISGGARLHFLLQDDDPWDRWEIQQEVIPEFAALFQDHIDVETFITVSGAERPPNLPGLLVYRRREWIVLDPSLKNTEGWIAACLNELLFAPPPRPFRLVMADGRTYDVRQPETTRLTSDRLLIETPAAPAGGPPIVESFPFDQITAIEPLGPSATETEFASQPIRSTYNEYYSDSGLTRATTVRVADARQNLETIGRIGVDLLENRIYPILNPADEGKFVVVDTISGAYEIDDDELVAVKRLREHHPDAAPFLGRFGYPAAYLLRSPR